MLTGGSTTSPNLAVLQAKMHQQNHNFSSAHSVNGPDGSNHHQNMAMTRGEGGTGTGSPISYNNNNNDGSSNTITVKLEIFL
jgi:hypothetical protein